MPTDWQPTGRPPGRPKLPVDQLKTREHGTRVRYMLGESGQSTKNGCRCFDCTQAAVLYEKLRQRRKANGWEPYVDATEAREHLRWLSSIGVGTRALCASTGMHRSVLQKIKVGTTKRIRPETESKILAVHKGLAADHAYIANPRVFELVAELKANGFTESDMCKFLGYKGRSLQLSKTGKVTPAKAARITHMHMVLMAPIVTSRAEVAQKQFSYRERKITGDLKFRRNPDGTKMAV